MSTTNGLFSQAQLAEAAYADLTTAVENQSNLLITLDVANKDQFGGSFSPAQAEAFVAQWQVIDQYTAPSYRDLDLSGTGFSATLFKNIDSSSPNYGAYTFAIRGSTGVNDFIEDAKIIVRDGIAIEQLVDLYNYWTRLNTSTGATYEAAYLQTAQNETDILAEYWTAATQTFPPPSLDDLIAYQDKKADLESAGYFVQGGLVIELVTQNSGVVFAGTSLEKGAGKLLTPLPSLDVVGHSLGGHLAMAFTRLFPNTNPSALAVNGLGFKNGNAAVDVAFAKLGGAAAFTPLAIQNVYGIGGPEFASMNNGNLQQPGGWDGVFIEDNSILPPAFRAHSTVQMTDSLAVYDLFVNADNTIATRSVPDALAFLNPLFEAASATAKNSLEAIVDALGKQFVWGYQPLVSTDPKSPSRIDDREALFTSIVQIRAGLPAAGLTLVPLTDKTHDQLKTAAAQADATGLATRYALRELNPFAIVGAEYSNYPLTLLDEATGTGDLSDNWLTDRAAMLSWVMKLNTEDALASVAVPYSIGSVPAQYFQDVASGKKLVMGGPLQGFSTRHFIFGTDTDNTKTQGADVISGGAASDRLYGQSGLDILSGQAGNDLLEAGADNDLLLGGTGDDQLQGGRGLDSYVWNSGDGNDTLTDSDKQGRILIDGTGVKLLVKQADGTWQSPDGKVTLTQGDTWKLTTADGGSIDLGPSFTDGDYGINRLEQPTLPVGALPIVGDRQPRDNPTGTDASGNPTYAADAYDANGNLYVAATPAPDRDDTLYGTATGQRLFGGGGDDVLLARGGADIVEAGDGNDIASGEGGDDAVFARFQTDLADAWSANEAGDGQAVRGDWVDGDSGNDLLVGSNARDLLSGGQNNDLMLGGAGDDLLLGDATFITANRNWSVTPDISTDAAGVTHYIYRINNATTDNPTDTGGADALHGGSGNDWALGGAGDDLVDGGSDNDVLFGDAGNDVVLGGAGDDVLVGDNANLPAGQQGDDWLDGGAGNDTLFGGGGADVLIGGAGDDKLYGGAGKDTYFIGADGKDHWDDPDKDSVIIFGDDVRPEQIKLRKGSLLLDFGNGAELHIDNFNSDDPLANASVASFQFADGTSLDWAQLLARGFDLDGTDGDDYIEGTGLEDRIAGLGGNDTLFGLAGDDVITGGTGTDGMNGGLGDDTYVFEAGDGATTTVLIDGQPVALSEALADDGGVDTVRFGASVNADDLRLTGQSDGSLLIDYSAPDQPLDRLLIANGQAGSIERYKVGSGDTALDLGYEAFVGTFGTGIFSGTDDAGRLHVAGGKTDDLIVVSEANARVSGGRGGDTLLLTGDAATVLVHADDGQDRLDVFGTNATLRFADQTAEQINVSRAGNDLVFSAGSDSVTVGGWLADDGLAAGLQRIEFADDTAWDGNAIRAKLLAGTAGNDHLIGYAGADAIDGGVGDDVIEGRGGDDTLSGGDGADTIDGGAGADVLTGGTGADVYVFAPGSGADTVIDGGAEGNILRFAAGQSMMDLRAVQEGQDLRLLVRGTADSVTVKDYFAGGQNWQVDFGGSGAVTAEQMLAQPDPVASAIGALWNGKVENAINGWGAYAQYMGWTAIGNLTYEDPYTWGYGNASYTSAVTTQTTTTTYRDANFQPVVSYQDVTSSAELSGYAGNGPNPSWVRHHFLADRVVSNEALIAPADGSGIESTYGTALATIRYEGLPFDIQTYQWSQVFALPSQGPAFGGWPWTDTKLTGSANYSPETWGVLKLVTYLHELTEYSRKAVVESYTDDTSGWTAPRNVVVDNQVALGYERLDRYQRIVSEIIAGDGDNEIHGTSGLNLIDGGAESNVLRFAAWQTPASLRSVREGDDLRLVVRGSADSVNVKSIVSTYAKIRIADMLSAKKRRRIAMPAAHSDTSWRMAA